MRPGIDAEDRGVAKIGHSQMAQSPVKLDVIQPRRGGGAVVWALQIYRLLVVAVIVLMIREHTQILRVQGDAPLTVEEVRTLLPAAARLAADLSPRLGLEVYDETGRRIGYAVRTSPLCDGVIGYRGRTDTLIVLDADQKVLGIRIRTSDDTREHVEDVGRDRHFMKTWNGMTWDQVSQMDLKSAEVEGVSGATLTSMAMANGIVQRFRYSTEQVNATEKIGLQIAARDVGGAIVLIIALVMAFTSLRGRAWFRHGFQVLLIGYVGFFNGDFVAQSLLAGWAAGDVPWRLAPGMALIVAAALIVPWSTRRPLYCSHICPHGAAQELIGRISPWSVHVPVSVARGLRWLPALLIAVVVLVVMQRLTLDLAGIEPFDAYLIRTAGAATIVVAVIGLVASLFVRQAYCKYGCPTGAVLEFVRSHGRADRFGRRDIAAGILVLFVTLLYFQHDPIHALIVGGGR